MSDDKELVLVDGKKALVLINMVVTNNTAILPKGTVTVVDSKGVKVQDETPLQPPKELSRASTEVPSKATHYSAVLDSTAVVAGMKIVVSFSSESLSKTITPRVIPSYKATLVAIPVQLDGNIGALSDSVATLLESRMPFAAVAYAPRVPFLSSIRMPQNEGEWPNTMRKLVLEVESVRIADKADHTHYYVAYVPKTTYGTTGMGFRPGRVSVVAGFWPNHPVPRNTTLHEVGHNLSLGHAPCGATQGLDPQYPYANANLGAPGRFVWGYNFESESFIDPRDVRAHDLMSYCGKDAFSDYNYRIMQRYLNPAAANETLKQNSHDSENTILISGYFDGNDTYLLPLKNIRNSKTTRSEGPYIARLTTATGVINHRFSASPLDHLPSSSGFAFSLENPGRLEKLEILNGDRVLFSKFSAKKAEHTKQAGIESVLFEFKENYLHLRWNSNEYSSLSIRHHGEKTVTLAIDLTDGFARIPLENIPAGGKFEFILSDGLNSKSEMKFR